MRMSPETIYQPLFVQTKGELKRELTAHRRTQRRNRKPQIGNDGPNTHSSASRPACRSTLRPSVTLATRHQREHQRAAGQCWAKGSDLRALTQTECDEVAMRLNTRPRKTLEWRTPARVLNARLVVTIS